MRIALSEPETATGPMGPLLFLVLAETVRFELTDPCGSAVFKTAGLNRSPKSPGAMSRRGF